MKVLLFGATGGTGKEVLTQALEEGHFVKVIVRDPTKIKVESDRLKIVQGDLLISDIEKEFHNQDAVICCIGAPANNARNLRSEGTRIIIEGMRKANVKRLICQSSLGFGDSKEVLNCTSFFFKRIVVPFILKSTFKEHHLQEIAIHRSDLYWTIVRPGNLTNGVKTEKYKLGFSYSDPSLKVKISRADVAHLMVKQLSVTKPIQNTLGISY